MVHIHWRIASLPITNKAHAFLTHRLQQRLVPVLLTLAIVAVMTISCGTSGTTGTQATSTPTALPAPSPTTTATTTSLKEGTTLFIYQSPYRIVSSVAWSPDNKRVVMADNTVRSFDATTGNNPVLYQKQMNGDVINVSWSPNGHLIAGSGTQVELWDATTGQSVGTFGSPQNVGSIPSLEELISVSAWSPDSRLIASNVHLASIEVWDVQTKQVVYSIPADAHSTLHYVQWSPDGKFLAFDSVANTSSGPSTTVSILNWATKKIVSQKQGVNLLAWSPDSTNIVSFEDGYTGAVQVWDSLTGKAANRIQVQDPAHGLSYINSASWSPDGKFLVLAMLSIGVWNVQTGQQVVEYKQHVSNGGNYPQALSWSSDGTMIVSCSGGETGPATVNVWRPF